MMAGVPSKKASGQQAFTQNFFPGVNKSIDMLSQSNQQKQHQSQIAQLLQQLRGGQQQPQMPQGQPQAQAPMPNPMQNAIKNQTTMGNSPLGLLGQTPQNQGQWTYIGPAGQ